MEDKEIRKYLGKVSDIIEKIPYKYCYFEIKTENDRYTLEKDKPTTTILGFGGGQHK